MQPQVFDVLGYLITHRDRVVPKEELLDEIWGDRFVSESTLTSRIKVARQIVGDNGTNQTTIQTMYGRGYRWVGGVDELPDPAEPDASEPLPPDPHHEQRIHFCRTPDGVRVAYATVGHGPPLVRSAHWITHLEYDWRSPVWRHWLDGLSRHRTLVRYDERGCGLSDHDPEELTFETFVQDLEVVVDDLGLDVFPLLGVSQGGPVAVEYARRHPGRVSHLILVGAFVKGRLARADDPDNVASNDLQRDLIRIGWGLDDAIAPPLLLVDVHARRLARALDRLRATAAPDHLGRERAADLRRLGLDRRHHGGSRGDGPDNDCARS